MKYNCNFCNYYTDILFCYQKHLTTKKHTLKSNTGTINQLSAARELPDNSSKAFTCPYCNNKYTRVNNLTQHKKICPDKDKIEKGLTFELEKKEEEIKHLKELYQKDIEKYKQNAEKDDEMKKQLQDQVSHLKTLINNAGAVIKTSVSALSFVAQNYDKAPLLRRLKDYSYIKEKDDDEDNDDNENTDTDDKFDLMETLIYHNNKETIQEYLGNIIVEAYKKKDPNKQSIWNSDTVRLTYVIRDLINKKPDWSVDKKGIKTTKYVIDPLLEYIRNQAVEYLDQHKLENYVDETETVIRRICDKINTCGKIIVTIDNKELSRLILKYIAPHFYLAKPDQLLEE